MRAGRFGEVAHVGRAGGREVRRRRVRRLRRSGEGGVRSLVVHGSERVVVGGEDGGVDVDEGELGRGLVREAFDVGPQRLLHLPALTLVLEYHMRLTARLANVRAKHYGVRIGITQRRLVHGAREELEVGAGALPVLLVLDEILDDQRLPCRADRVESGRDGVELAVLCRPEALVLLCINIMCADGHVPLALLLLLPFPVAHYPAALPVPREVLLQEYGRAR